MCIKLMLKKLSHMLKNEDSEILSVDKAIEWVREGYNDNFYYPQMDIFVEFEKKNEGENTFYELSFIRTNDDKKHSFSFESAEELFERRLFDGKNLKEIWTELK